MVALAVLGAPELSAQTQYTVDPIEAPDGFALYPSAINNTGVVTGWWYGSPVTNRQPFIYSQDSGYNLLPKPAGMEFSVPQDINDAGVIVGFATSTWSDEGNPRGWVYENGAFTMFPSQSSASAINASGLVVGKACVAGTSFTCMFSSENAPEITTFPGAGGYPVSMWKYIVVNDAGQMAYNASGTSVVFRDVDGTLTPLPPPPSGWTGIRVDGINNAGQVIARWTRSTTLSSSIKRYSRGFVWSAATGAQEFDITAYSIRPMGINNQGQVIIESGTHDQAFFDCWVWSPQTGAVNLDNATDYGDNLVLTDLYDINDAGQVLAGGSTITLPGDIYVVLNPAGSPAAAGDVTRDGAVNVDDLLAVINGWGECPPPPGCPADMAPAVPGDGVVNVDDLLMVINSWG